MNIPLTVHDMNIATKLIVAHTHFCKYKYYITASFKTLHTKKLILNRSKNVYSVKKIKIINTKS